MSNWFKYLIKTPIAQIRRDIKEYKYLDVLIENWAQLTAVAKESVVMTYDCCDDFHHGNSCIKRQVMFYKENDEGVEVPVYRYSRCNNYVPRDNENVCVNQKCECWNRNRIYCNNNKKYVDARKQKAEFWKNKFAKVK